VDLGAHCATSSLETPCSSSESVANRFLPDAGLRSAHARPDFGSCRVGATELLRLTKTCDFSGKRSPRSLFRRRHRDVQRGTAPAAITRRKWYDGSSPQESLWHSTRSRASLLAYWPRRGRRSTRLVRRRALAAPAGRWVCADRFWPRCRVSRMAGAAIRAEFS